MKKQCISLMLALAVFFASFPQIGITVILETGVKLMSLTRTEATVAETGNRFAADSGVFADSSELTAWNNNQQVVIGGTGRTPIVINNNQTTATGGWYAASIGGVDNASAFQIKFSTLGYDDIRFSCRQKSTGSGPDAFKLAYRIGSSGSFVPVDDSLRNPVRVSNDTYDALQQTYENFSLPSAMYNQGEVYLRVYFDGSTTLGVNGNTSINNIIISSGEVDISDEIEVPVPENERLIFSHEAGLYTQSFSLTLTTGYENGIIRYTTDGSDPTVSSTPYSSAINIADRTNDANVLSAITNIAQGGGGVGGGGFYTAPSTRVFKGNVIKAQVFDQNGNALSGIVTKSYFVNANMLTRYKLPVISIVTHRDNFFNNSTGIYVNGNWSNTGADWERPVNVEIFDVDGSTAVSQKMGVRIHGGVTRNNAQKSLRLYASSSRDPDNPRIAYDLFEGGAKAYDGSEITSFRRVILRSSGQDHSSTMMRDAMMQSLVDDLNVGYQAYRQSVVFLNGEFWGIYNIRERYDEYKYADSIKVSDETKIGSLGFGLGGNNKPEDLSVWQADPITYAQELADYSAYNEMWNWFNNNTSLSSETNYAKAQTFLDIDNFIDFYAANIYFQNTDWPGNNIEMFRYRTAYPADASNINTPYGQDGRWRWSMKDLDFGFGGQGGSFLSNPLARLQNAISNDQFAPSWSTLLFRRLMTNSNFQRKFVNRLCDLMNTNFKASVVTDVINEMKNNIDGAMDEHIPRWRQISSKSTWNNNVNTMLTFANNRGSSLRGHMRSQYSLGVEVTLNLLTDGKMGHIRINSTDIIASTKGVTNPASWSGTYFANTIQTLTAIPQKGYAFSKFVVTNGSQTTESATNPLNLTLSTGTTSVTAVYEEKEEPDVIAVWDYPNGVAATSFPATSGRMTDGTALDFYYANGAKATLRSDNGTRAAINAANNSGGWYTAPASSISENASAGWIITLSTRSYKDIKFSAKQGASNSGPGQFKLAYRIGTEGPWIGFGEMKSVSVLSDNGDLGVTFDEAPLPEEMNNQISAQLKVYIASDVVRQGGSGSSLDPVGGNASMNNIVFSGFRDDNAVLTYVVTVTDGSGSGHYEANDVVSITADPAPDGHQFKEWQVISGGVSLSSTTTSVATFTMPENSVEIKAVYEPIPTYAVTVNGVKLGDFTAGEVVTASAGTPPAGQIFKEWTAIGVTLTPVQITANPLSFVMPAGSAILTAVFEAAPVTEYPVTVDGSKLGDYVVGTTVTITTGEPPIGKAFVRWEIVPDVDYVDGTGIYSETVKFIMPTNSVTANAVFETDISVDITDMIFRGIVYELIGKIDGEPIFASDVSGFAWLVINGLEIESLAGLEHFVGLTRLNCSNNLLTELPELPDGLIALECGDNLLTKLPELPEELIVLDCAANRLTALPTLPKSLITLICGNNLFTGLPTMPSGLLWLECLNNLLTGFDVTDLKLDYLNCSYNNMESEADVTGFIGEWDDINYIFSPQNDNAVIEEPNISVDERLTIKPLIREETHPSFSLHANVAVSGNLYVASYDANGRLASVSTQPFSLAAGEEIDVSASVPALAGGTYKFFIWDSNFAPMTAFVSVTKL